jgi:Ca2+-binding EF-hand superfamily protein
MNSGKFDVQDYQLVNKIISRNPNKEEIENAINLIDKNKDGRIEDEDVIEAEISLRKGLLQNIDPNILKTVFDSNTNTDKIQKTLDLFDSEKNGEMKINNFIDIVLNHRQGLLSIPDFSIFTKVIKTLDKEFNALKSLEILDSRNDGVISDKSFAQGILADRAGLAILNTELINHISNKNKNFQMIQSAISIMDSDNNGSINAEEFTNNFKAAISINGVVDFNKMSVISNVLDIIYPDAIKLDKFRDDLDVNKDTQLSDMEIIEGLLKLRNNVIENPGLDIIKMVISGNENYLKIIDSIDKIDLDLDGIISDSDCINGLIATRQGKFTNEQLPLVQAVLVKNTKYNELQNVLNVFDKDLNGEISDLELIDTMFKFRRGEIDINIDPQIIENLKDQNKNREKIEILISIIDPDNSGNIDNHELIKGILAVNSGAIERPIDEILVTLPNEKSEKFGEEILKAEILIKQIDQNKNGQIADNEVASIILANKKNDLLSTYSSEFTEAVFATNPKSTEIISLIDTIDKDQDGFFSEQEIIDAVLENRQGLLKTSSNEILEAVLTNNPEYSKIKNLISRVDIDGDGRISEQNIVESLFLFKDSKLPEKYSTINENKLDERSLELLDLILSKNKSKISLENSFNQLSINSNGDLMVMKNTLLELKFGEINNPEIENLVIPAQRIINNWDLQVKSSCSQEINMLIDIVGDQAINKNLSSLGLNSLEGFLTELNSIKNNLVNGKKTSFNELHRLINNYQTTVSSIPYSSPDIISKIFYEDFKTNLNTIKSFLDTGVINDHDSKFQEIAGLAIRFDKDQDGKFNDQELMNGLLDVKLNKVTVSNPEFLDLIFNSNSNYETIKNFISNADKDTNGLISKNDLINFYNSITQSNSINNKNLLSLMAEHDDLKTIFKTIKTFDIFGNAQYSDSAILLGLLQTRKQNNEIYDQETINSILTLNQDSTGIQKLVDIIDPDKNGLYHNIYDVLNNAISIWQGKIPSNNLAYDFNGDGIVNNKDASTLYNLHMSINNLSAFKIFN